MTVIKFIHRNIPEERYFFRARAREREREKCGEEYGECHKIRERLDRRPGDIKSLSRRLPPSLPPADPVAETRKIKGRGDPKSRILKFRRLSALYQRHLESRMTAFLSLSPKVVYSIFTPGYY